ncbi:TPA: EamA/RhaT family transporter, partial [Streptococcus pneumoniae]
LNVSYVVWTVLFAALFLGTSLDMLTIMTSLVVIAGVYIIIKE